MKLKDKVAIVTGAGSGIGRATALLFAQEGADVVVNDINLSSAKETSETIREMGRKTIANGADIADEKAVKEMVEGCIKDLGGIDILVNNAGIANTEPVLESTIET